MASTPSQPAPSSRDPGDDIARSAGERFGWLFGSLWLIFLAFPLGALIGSEKPLTEKVVGVLLVAGFVACYARANYELDSIGSETGVWAWGYLAALVAIAVVSILVFGGEALAFAPYISSWAIFALPRRWGVTIPLVCIGVSVLVAAVIDWRFTFFTFLIASVSLANGGLTLFMRSGQKTQELRLRTTLALDQERIARDVHDVLGHSLTAVVVKSELAQRLVLADPERARRELAEIESLSRTALAEIRATVDGMRASRLSDEVENSRLLLASVGIDLDVRDNAVDVDPRASVVLAWAVREATTNIVRHSGAHHASIRWGSDWVEITDDGRGFELADASGGSGSGLAGLRERVITMGGSMFVTNGSDGSGTTVRVEAAERP